MDQWANQTHISENEYGCVDLPYAAEIELEIKPGDCELDIFTNKAGEGGLSIKYIEEKKEITIDRSSLEKRFNISDGESRTRILENGLSNLRIYIDKSSIEIFVNENVNRAEKKTGVEMQGFEDGDEQNILKYKERIKEYKEEINLLLMQINTLKDEIKQCQIKLNKPIVQNYDEFVKLFNLAFIGYKPFRKDQNEALELIKQKFISSN